MKSFCQSLCVLLIIVVVMSYVILVPYYFVTRTTHFAGIESRQFFLSLEMAFVLLGCIISGLEGPKKQLATK